MGKAGRGNAERRGDAYQGSPSSGSGLSGVCGAQSEGPLEIAGVEVQPDPKKAIASTMMSLRCAQGQGLLSKEPKLTKVADVVSEKCFTEAVVPT